MNVYVFRNGLDFRGWLWYVDRLEVEIDAQCPEIEPDSVFQHLVSV
jgi:hypothetical protein